MKYQADLVAMNPSGDVILAVEVKSKRGVNILNPHETNTQWAARFYQALLEREIDMHRIAYFMLATPDVLYLWDNKQQRSQASIEPNYLIETRDIFDPHRLNLMYKADHQVLQMIFFAWIQQLHFFEKSNVPKAFIQSGLFDSLQDAILEYEVMI